MAYSVILPCTVSLSKFHSWVISKSLYQPASAKPSLVGSSGRVTFWPSFTFWSGTEVPPLLSNRTVHSSVTTTVTSRPVAA